MMWYSEASSSCNSIGGKPIVFNSHDEMALVGQSSYVVDYMNSKMGGNWRFWVGCEDQAVEGTFMCEDGTHLENNSGKFSNISDKKGITEMTIQPLNEKHFCKCFKKKKNLIWRN